MFYQISIRLQQRSEPRENPWESHCPNVSSDKFRTFHTALPAMTDQSQAAACLLMWACHSHPFSHRTYPIGSMYAIYGNIYHQYTPNVSIYTIHGSYGYMYIHLLSKIYEIGWSWQSSHSSGTWLQYSATFFHLVAMNILWQHIGMGQSWAPNGTLTSVDYIYYMFTTKSTK